MEGIGYSDYPGSAHSPASIRGPLKSSNSSSCPTLSMVARLDQRGGQQPWSSTAGCSGRLAAASATTECLALQSLYRGGVPTLCRTHLCPHSRPVITTACLAQQWPNRILGSALSGLRLWKILQWLWPHYLPTPSGGLTHALQGPTNTSCIWLCWGPGLVLPQPILTARSLWTLSTTHLGAWDGAQRDVREARPLSDPAR